MLESMLTARAIDVSLRIKVETQRSSKSSWPPSKSSLISRNEEIYTEGVVMLQMLQVIPT